MKIGNLTVSRTEPYVPNMQDAYNCDLEWGSHGLNNWRSTQFAAGFPTVIKMAALIEKERDRLRKENQKLHQQLTKLKDKQHDSV